MMNYPNWGFCYGDTSSHHRRRKANFWPFCDILRSRPTAWYQWSVGRTPITGKGETLFMSPSPTLGCTYIADRMYGHWIHGKIGYCGQSSIWDIYNESAFDGLNSEQISGLHCARYSPQYSTQALPSAYSCPIFSSSQSLSKGGTFSKILLYLPFNRASSLLSLSTGSLLSGVLCFSSFRHSFQIAPGCRVFFTIWLSFERAAKTTTFRNVDRVAWAI